MSEFKFALEEEWQTPEYVERIVRVAPELTGDEEDPLILSIEKWEFIVSTLQERPGIKVNDGRGITCALCAKYPDFCRGCPVMKLTGIRGCVETPYQQWAVKPSLAAAQAELEFLRGLKEDERG